MCNSYPQKLIPSKICPTKYCEDENLHIYGVTFSLSCVLAEVKNWLQQLHKEKAKEAAWHQLLKACPHLFWDWTASVPALCYSVSNIVNYNIRLVTCIDGLQRTCLPMFRPSVRPKHRKTSELMSIYECVLP